MKVQKILKALKILLQMLIGAAVGFGGVKLIFLLAGSDDAAPASSADEGIDWWFLALSIVISILSLAVCLVLHTILHEVGHLLFGLLTKYRFSSFRVFCWMVVKEAGGLRLRRYNIAGTMGQCIMLPPSASEATPYFWYNAGGVLVNLFLVAASLLLLRTFDCGIVLTAFLIMMAFVGGFMGFMNGLPLKLNGLSNDGRNIMLLKRRPAYRRYFASTLLVVDAQNRGVRVKDMPAEWFDDKPLEHPDEIFDVSQRLLWLCRLEDGGKYAEAHAVAEDIAAHEEQLPPLYRLEFNGERTLIELLTSARKEVIEKIWTKELERHLRQNSKYSAGKCVILYAYELLFRRDVEAASQYLQLLKSRKSKFPYPGEVRMAEKMTEDIDALAKSQGSASTN